MWVAPPNTQAIRSVNINSSTSTPPHPNEVIYIDVYTDPITKDKFILWEDIPFLNALHIRHKARVLPFMKGADFNSSRQQQRDNLALRARNKELAKQYARDAMSKVAAKMDLDALYAKGDGPPGDFWKALECYLNAVRKSHAHAQVSVGDLFSEGQGVTKDTSLAMVWYFKAAFQGDTNAQRKVETLTLSQLRQTAAPKAPANNAPKGKGRGRNLTGVQTLRTNNERRLSNDSVSPATKSLDRIFLSANCGDKDAQVTLGDLYREGKGVSQDHQAAMNWYLKAAEQGNPVGQQCVGAMYSHGLGVPKNHSTAMAWFLKAAEQGNAKAQCNIGLIYENGDGVTKDHTQAKVWYLRAADQGLADALYNLGLLYNNSNPPDYTGAMDWYLKAAEQGHTGAQHSIGLLHSNGQGVPQDYAQAMTWYHKAAKQGYPPSQYSIGRFYDDGRGVHQDYVYAMTWYLRAANQGHASAQYSIGILHSKGQGTAQDDVQAMDWFLKAANQGHSDSLYSIGVLYHDGQGVPQSYTKAAEWFQMAANQESHEAFLKLRELRKSHLETPSTPTSTLPEWAYHSRCCDDGRTRHIVENAPYMLPNDLPESDRLDAQHYLVRFILKGNYNVHLDSESPDLRILDVATGTGVWALEMAREFPKAEIHGVDISAIFPIEGNPPNCNFQLCNILDGLPFPDNHFDFIYQRLLVYALSPAQRRQVNVELLRVLKPEGFLQLVESDGIVYNPGPQMEKINQLSLETSLRHGVDPRVVQTMKSGLKQSGYTNVNSVNIALPVGAWGGKVGSLSLQNMHGLATIWLRGEVGNMTRDECDALLVVADKECEVNQSYYKVWLVIGAKPNEPKNITASSSTTTTPNTSGKAQVLASSSSSSSDTRLERKARVEEGRKKRVRGNRPLGFSSSRISPIPALPPTVIKSSFPVYNPTYIDEQADANFELAFAVVRSGRSLMTNYNITKRVQIYILGSIEIAKLLRSDEAAIAT
ncbi:hypothetical protein BGZ88_007653 [Linnemannia elongata]|nr:hypothetical protein BGZ88_007653 [Linnemannia elongata]